MNESEQAKADAAHEAKAIEDYAVKIEGLFARADQLEETLDLIEREAVFTESELADLEAHFPDVLPDAAIGLRRLKDLLEARTKIVSSRLDAATKMIVSLWEETGTASMKRHGVLLSLAVEYWPGAAWRDLLPPGVDPNDDNYRETVKQCRQAGKLRMIEKLKSSPLSYLVEEGVNSQSLRSALAGREAERDEDDVPVIPGELEGAVEMNPRTVVRMRKSR